MLVAMVIGILVVGVVLGLMVISLHVQKNSNTRAVATQEGTAMLQRIDREIRDASSATICGSFSACTTNPPTAATSCSVSGYSVCGGVIDLNTPVAGSGGTSSTMNVVYDCVSQAYCTRAVGPVNGALGSSQPLIDQNVSISSGSANSVFRAANGTQPTYIYVVLDQTLGSPYKNPLEFQDGIALRNNIQLYP